MRGVADIGGRVLRDLRAPWDFTRFTVHRFFTDSCPNWAGALSYTTLLSLVPLSAIAFCSSWFVPGWRDAMEV